MFLNGALPPLPPRWGLKHLPLGPETSVHDMRAPVAILIQALPVATLIQAFAPQPPAVAGFAWLSHGHLSVDVAQIKKSIALRAKYRKGQGDGPCYVTLDLASAVPHPKNRGGVPVASLRTKELGNFVAKEGCDPVEARSSAVAVENTPDHHEWGSFQKHFSKQAEKMADMCGMLNDIPAVAGTLSHGHFTCLSRNIIKGEMACTCIASRGGGLEILAGARDPRGCICDASAIYDAAGRYSLTQLHAYDSSWGDLIVQGIPFEMLDKAIDKEEPDGALVISIALNKKNEAAMKTGHTEIMNTLVSLCKPSPEQKTHHFFRAHSQPHA